MADIIMVSSLGEAAVSGVSLVDTINILIINIFAALATGGAVVASQYLGKNEEGNARKAAGQLIVTTVTLSLVIMAISLALNTRILGLVFGDTEADVMENAATYFWVSALSFPFLAVYNSCAAIFRSMGNSKVSMLTSLIMNVVNIGGNAIFIFGFGMGVFGAALSSLISRALSAAVILILIRNKKLTIHIESFRKIGINFKMIKNILRIGVPNGMENGMFQLGKILVQSLVTSFGTIAIAANAAAGTVASFACICGAAIGLAMITVVGQLVGANDYEGAVKYIKQLMKAAYVLTAVVQILIIIFCDTILSWYNLKPETIEIARSIIIYHSICAMFIWPTSFTLPNALRAANDVKFTMILSVASMWICRIGLSYVFASLLNLGVFGVWVAMTIDWIVRAVFFMARIVRGKWKNKQYV